MAHSGRSLATTALLGLSAVLFVRPLTQAVDGLSYTGPYGGELSAVTEYAPLLLAFLAVLVLAQGFLS